MKKNPYSTLLMVILVPVVLYITIMLVFGHSATSWHVSELPDTGSKTSYANHTLLPGISGYIDRTGMRGFQDTELQLETREFSTLGGLYGILPQSSKEDLKRVMASTPVETKDIKAQRSMSTRSIHTAPLTGKVRCFRWISVIFRMTNSRITGHGNIQSTNTRTEHTALWSGNARRDIKSDGSSSRML